MQTAPTVLSLLLIILSYTGWTNGLCYLENGTAARCHELKDVKYIETYHLDTLKATVSESVLRPGYFTNLTSLRHLDLSGGDLKRIEPGSFRKLTNLRSLNLAENHIRHLEFASRDGLNHLHSLNLRKNNIRELSPTLAHLKALRHFDAQGNPLQCSCATLRVRDLIENRGVKISKKVLCAGPANLKGTPLFKPDAETICKLEEQDREMQKDQGYSDTAEEYGSGDDPDTREYDDYVEATDATAVAPKEVEVETPFPETSSTSFVTEPTSSVTEPAAKTMDTEVTNGELFFDSEEKKDQTTTLSAITSRTKVYKDALFYPVDGSGDGDEGSGEGSGTGVIFDDWRKTDEVDETSEKEEESVSLGDRLFDSFINLVWSTTQAPETKKDLGLEEEQFIDASVNKEVDEKPVVPKNIDLDETVPSTTDMTSGAGTMITTDGVELVDNKLHDMSKMGKVKVDDEEANDEMAVLSPAKQSKKGMGSYVVLAALLAILATLIVFAAYKGDFCKKKRKRGDVENGTELRDMQKALLETGNSPQPKIASNGNVENAPLVEDITDHEEIKRSNDGETDMDAPKSLNGTSERTDPVKPPRRTGQDGNSLKTDSLSARTSPVDPAANNGPVAQLSEANGPPLSPGAQRVKITLQENPDSVPRTPILITRTMAGENLVKTP